MHQNTPFRSHNFKKFLGKGHVPPHPIRRLVRTPPSAKTSSYGLASRYLASFARYLAPKLQQTLLRDDVISDVISPWSATVRTMQTYHIVEHCVNASSNSDKNCWRSILKKNHDVTIITSSGQVKSSEACAVDSP